MYIDSHAHLNAPEFLDDLAEVVERAKQAGVESIIVPGTDVESSRKAVELADRFSAVYACVGIHPHDASKADGQFLQEIEELSAHPKVVAIGEIGLDFFKNFSPRGAQVEALKNQLDIARRRNLPIVVHNRDAHAELLDIMEETIRAGGSWRSNLTTPYSRFPALKGVFHAFSGDAAMAWKLINMGFYVSIPGTITFKNSSVRQVVQEVSVEHWLLETDSPYLTPVPFRGKRNEPSYLAFIAKRLAEIRSLSVEDVSRTTNYNIFKLFGIGEPEPPKIAYTLNDTLYLNITIRCNADCVFCDRKGEAVIKGHNLRIEREPTSQEVIEAIGDPTRYSEIAFCGYGEPTIRLDVIKEVARWVKGCGGKVRLNTDGHGNVINRRNIVPELVGLVDSVSISLNSIDPKQYGELMRIDGQRFFSAMVKFAKECVRHFPEVVMTIVDLCEVEQEKARRFVEQEIGAKFKVRPFF
ncbi:MAG: TatD family hydrolase [Bacteroidota bacterium]